MLAVTALSIVCPLRALAQYPNTQWYDFGTVTELGYGSCVAPGYRVCDPWGNLLEPGVVACTPAYDCQELSNTAVPYARELTSANAVGQLQDKVREVEITTSDNKSRLEIVERRVERLEKELGERTP
jgi:hypothetical protein